MISKLLAKLKCQTSSETFHFETFRSSNLMQHRQQNDSKEWKGKVECKKPQCMKVKMRKKNFFSGKRK